MPSSEQPNRTAYPAGLGRRFGAAVYDALLIIAIWMGTLFVWVLANDGEAVKGIEVQLVLLLEMIAFYLYFWSRDGQTLGMTAWRIKLVDHQGKPPSFKQLALRLICAPLSIVSLGIGYLWFYVGDRRQTWHDRLSETMVVHLPKDKKSAK